MKRMLSFAAAALAATLAADAGANGLKRMYVLDCGRLIAKDQSRWTPGVNAGQPRELSNNCYLFQHERGTLLWETGVPDSVAEQKDGVTAPSGVIVWFRNKTLKSQLESLGVKPEDMPTSRSRTHTATISATRRYSRSRRS
jgi:N-acyl homoserine lactone hydrolase